MNSGIKKAVALTFILLCGCTPINNGGSVAETDAQNAATTPLETTAAATQTQPPTLAPALSQRLSALGSYASEDFLKWCALYYGGELLTSLNNTTSADMSAKEYNEAFYAAAGESAYTAYSRFGGDALSEVQSDDKLITITFGGDVSLADNWHTMQYLKTTENGISDCISADLISEMQNADVSVLNNEFAFSDRGNPMSGKMYTFVGKTENVGIYGQLGTDIVSLANNHCYDYGKEAFGDTLSTLASAGIDYIGAGADINEAEKPVYRIVNGRKIAFVAATRAEKYILTPEATQTSGGVLRAYDPTAFCKVISDTAAVSDYVIAYIHWGTEGSNVLEKAQLDTGKMYVEAGADIVVGAHAHCLQGVEFCSGSPVFYNLGNFWFNKYDIDTALLKITLDPDRLGTGDSFELIPCIQRDCITRCVRSESDGKRILNYIEKISVNADIADNGIVTQKQ